MPAYNCSSTIEESVNSIINGNINEGDEIVICDDGSTDDTLIILKELSKKFNFIKIIEHKVNSGGAVARNTAISNSTNDLIFCLDSDNVLFPKSVEKLKNFLITSQADVAAFQELRFFKKYINIISHKWIFPEGVFNLSDHLSGHVCPGASGNYLFTKNIWLKAGGYPVFAKSLDAWGFGFRQLAVGAKMIVLPDSFYFHRYGHKSYWVREAKNNLSQIAFAIVSPYEDLIDEADFNYLKSNDWFANLEIRPVKLKNKLIGKTGKVVFDKNIKNLLRNIFRKILKK
jgi:glycosyltransferase involved in cell wall biosynthesis